MHNCVGMPIGKENLKHGTFKNMVNEKCYSLQNNLGRKSHVDLLNPSHKVQSMNLREARKMINADVDP